MKILLALLIPVILLSSCSFGWDKAVQPTSTGSSFSENWKDVTYAQYHNPKYNFSIQYPDSLSAQPTNEEWDGVSFKNANGVEIIRAFGYRDLDTRTGKRYVLADKRKYDEWSLETIDSEEMFEDGFEISGFTGDLNIFHKTLLTSNEDNGAYWIDLIIQTPTSGYEQNLDVINTILDSLKIGK